MLPKRNYYLNDYFDLFTNPYQKEKEYLKTDIYEVDNRYVLEMDIPGLKKENIKINYEFGYLSILINKGSLPVKPNAYIRRERFYGELRRSFYIGIKHETDIKAKYINGLLTITFPKVDIQKKDEKNITIN